MFGIFKKKSQEEKLQEKIPIIHEESNLDIKSYGPIKRPFYRTVFQLCDMNSKSVPFLVSFSSFVNLPFMGHIEYT